MKKIMRKFLLSVTGKLILSLLLDDFKKHLIEKVLKSDVPVSSQTVIIKFIQSINDELVSDLFKKHNVNDEL
jgi:hypothetical protein